MSNTVGRPRLKQSQRPSMEAADEILDAAAELFTTQGYSATSTRQIAESVGLQQASIYHYFATKHSILRTLLLSTVEATIAALPGLLANEDHAAARLHSLARFDSAQLLTSTWNLGALYLLPEVRGSEFDDFTRARRDLREAYASLVDEIAVEESLVFTAVQRELPFRVVETVISIRMDPGEVPATLSVEIADAALRTLGVASHRWVGSASAQDPGARPQN